MTFINQHSPFIYVDQQPRHESADPEGLCEAALPSHPAARLRTRCGEDHYV